MRDDIVVSPEIEEQRVLLLKEWSRRRLKQQAADLQNLRRIELAQRLALDELRQESEELYQAAIQVSCYLTSQTSPSFFFFLFASFFECTFIL